MSSYPPSSTTSRGPRGRKEASGGGTTGPGPISHNLFRHPLISHHPPNSGPTCHRSLLPQSPLIPQSHGSSHLSQYLHLRAPPPTISVSRGSSPTLPLHQDPSESPDSKFPSCPTQRVPLQQCPCLWTPPSMAHAF